MPDQRLRAGAKLSLHQDKDEKDMRAPIVSLSMGVPAVFLFGTPTVSILAGIDLHSGHIFANVEDRHRSIEFIALPRQLDAHYPEDAIIRVVLDNHSTHISKETLAYLSSRPGRFEYVHTPKHGYWLNLIECAFSKMVRTFLRHIRVTSKDDLKQRILKGIAEINASPVVFRWNKFDLGVT